MIMTDGRKAVIKGNILQVSQEMLNLLVAFKQALNEAEPEIADKLYDGIVVAGSYGDLDEADAYFARENAKFVKENMEAETE
jgi:hypothetical protein